MDKKTYSFTAVIKKMEDMDAGFIEFPYDVEKEFGKKGQVKVKAYFDSYEYRGSLAKMGHHCHFIGLNKKVRQAIGKNPGDEVQVIIEQDLEERNVTVPPDFEAKLVEFPEALNFFNSLAFTHKREYVQWIEEAKKQETRERRIEKAIEMLMSKKKEAR